MPAKGILPRTIRLQAILQLLVLSKTLLVMPQVLREVIWGLIILVIKQGGFHPTMESKGLEAYYGKDIFLSEALTLETIKALDTAASTGKPFFLYMAHYAVHTPYKPDNRFYLKYIDKGYARNEAMYASIVEGMDKSLGDLMDYVERKEIADNTIILFMSDNGGLALTPPRDGEMYSQNAPLRSGKDSLYEGGIREPMLAYWPGITKAGSVNNQYLIIEVFFPPFYRWLV